MLRIENCQLTGRLQSLQRVAELALKILAGEDENVWIEPAKVVKSIHHHHLRLTAQA